jgi:hypothetical protein
MAREVQDSNARGEWLQQREKEFVEDMVRWCQRREPTEKQGKWLHSLWVRARVRQ